MLENVPILTHKHDQWTIEGYSRAAVQTYWRVPELKLGFDLGAQPWDFILIWITSRRCPSMSLGAA